MAQLWIFAILVSAFLTSTTAAEVEIISTPREAVIPKQLRYEEFGKYFKGKEISKQAIQNFIHSITKKSRNYEEYNEIQDSSNSQAESKRWWPKVFVLKNDPSYPVVCFSGVYLNGCRNTKDTTLSSSLKKRGGSKNRPTRIFPLYLDSDRPMLCREGHIPAKLANDGPVVVVKTSGRIESVSCIRRDYEKNISALFLHQTGPIQTAWNVFDRSITYGYFNIQNVEKIHRVKIVNETVVDCGRYHFTKLDEGISYETACSLSG